VLRAPRVEAGLRFIMVSLSVAAVAMALPQFVITFVVPSTVLVPGLHLLLLPGIFLTLYAAIAVSGFAGFLTLEWNRATGPTRNGWRWDAPCLAGVLAVLAAASFFGSGIALGYVYLPEDNIVRGVHLFAVPALALCAGLYLFWTAQRMDPDATILRRLALSLGIASVVLAMTTRLGPTSDDPVPALVLGLSATITGMFSLLAWIVVYGGIYGKSRSTERPSIVSG